MALFGLFGKKKDGACCCSSNAETKQENKPNNTDNTEISVKVLGSGCKKCNELEANTKLALEELNMDTTIDHVTDFSEIANYGVMSTPALVIDGKVVAFGKLLKKDEVVTILKKVRG